MGSALSCLTGGLVAQPNIDCKSHRLSHGKAVRFPHEVTATVPGIPSAHWSPCNDHDQQAEEMGTCPTRNVCCVSTSPPPVRGCEQQRLDTTQALNVLTKGPRRAPSNPLFRNILELTARTFNIKDAAIFLVSDTRVVPIEALGAMERAGDSLWKSSFRPWTMASEQPQILLIPDTTADTRFSHSKEVAQSGVRFYCDAPLLTTSGQRLGVICFTDSIPRPDIPLSDCQCLTSFATIIVGELQRGTMAAAAAGGSDQQQQQGTLQVQPSTVAAGAVAAAATAAAAAGPTGPSTPPRRATPTPGGAGAVAKEDFPGPEPAAAAAAAGFRYSHEGSEPIKTSQGLDQAMLVVDTSHQAWPLLHANRAWAHLTGAGEVEAVGRSLWELFQQEGGGPLGEEQLRAVAVPDNSSSSSTFFVPGLQCRLGRCRAKVTLRFSPLADEQDKEGLGQVCNPTDTIHGDRPRNQAPTWYLVWVTPNPSQPEAAGANCGDATASDTAVAAAGQAVASPGSSSSSPVSCSGSDTCFLEHKVLACQRLEGLELEAPVAAGSYGRVYRGLYRGQQVAVKVLDDCDVIKRDLATGMSLEGLLAEKLHHPHIVTTLAFAVVEGEAQLPPRSRAARVGETWGTARLPCPAAAATEEEDSIHPSSKSCSKELPLAAAAAVTPAVAPATAAAATTEDAGGLRATAAAASVSNGGWGLSQPLSLTGRSGSSANWWGYSHSRGLDSYSHLSCEGQTWLVMEYCNKGCLQDAIDKGWLRQEEEEGGAPDLLTVILTAHEIAAGMHYLHQQGIVHGDLSAFNIMLTSAGGGPGETTGAAAGAAAAGRSFTAKVADFGLARDLGINSRVHTKTYGTITHMAPEMLEVGCLSKAADVYSFGVLLWQMYCSSRAWAGMSHTAIIRAVCVDKQQLAFPEGAPEGYVALARACLAFEAPARPSFQDVVEVLQPLADMARQVQGAAARA